MPNARVVFLVAAAGLVAAAVLVGARYAGDLGQARQAVAAGGRIAETAAVPIEYAVGGEGPPLFSIPLFSIHGAGGGYDQGLALAASLVGGGFQVIAPSRFGYLRTPIPADVSPAAQADAHDALLAKLGVGKAIVLGVSAGARSAIELALRHPDRVAALILVVPAAYSPDSQVSIQASKSNEFVFWMVNAGADFFWWAAEKIAPSVLIRFVGVRPELVAAATPADRGEVMDVLRAIEPLSARFPGINIDSNPDLRRLPLEEIAVPTLIISARDDLFNTVPAAEFAASRIPGAKLVIFESGGHLMVGRGREVRAIVGDFLARAGLATRGALAQPSQVVPAKAGTQ